MYIGKYACYLPQLQLLLKQYMISYYSLAALLGFDCSIRVFRSFLCQSFYILWGLSLFKTLERDQPLLPPGFSCLNMQFISNVSIIINNHLPAIRMYVRISQIYCCLTTIHIYVYWQSLIATTGLEHLCKNCLINVHNAQGCVII